MIAPITHIIGFLAAQQKLKNPKRTRQYIFTFEITINKPLYTIPIKQNNIKYLFLAAENESKLDRKSS